MSIGKRYAMVIFSLFICSSTFAQYSEDDGGIESKNGYLRYIGLGAGATYQVMNDEGISPLEYWQVSALPMYTHMKVNSAIFTDLCIRGSRVNLSHDRDTKEDRVKVRVQRALADYRFLVRVPLDSRYYDVRAGGLLSAYFANKQAPQLVDAQDMYEYAVSVGLCGKVSKEVVIGDNSAFLTFDIGIPFFANISRPYYLNRKNLSDPERKALGEIFNNAASGSIGKYFRLDTRLAVMYRLENGNILQVGYEWDYTRMKTHNKAFFAEHIISLMFMFNY